MIPDLDLARVRRWIDERNAGIPAQARDRIRFEIDLSDRAITIVERRPPWPADEVDEAYDGHDEVDVGHGEDWSRESICRFTYTMTRTQWSLLWPDSNDRFHLYDQVEPTPHIDALIEEVNLDPTGVFWG